MEKIIQKLIKKAQKCAKKGEIPVAAAIVDKNNKIIAMATNNRQKKNNIIGHAEIICIQKTCKKIKDWRLNGYTMYVTLKPCKMCTTIINESRLDKVFYILDRKHVDKNDKTKIELWITSKENKQKYQKMLKKFFEKIR